MAQGVILNKNKDCPPESINKLFDYYRNKLSCVSEGVKKYSPDDISIARSFSFNTKTEDIEGILFDIDSNSISGTEYKRKIVM